jgi:hypothetical protein
MDLFLSRERGSACGKDAVAGAAVEVFAALLVAPKREDVENAVVPAGAAEAAALEVGAAPKRDDVPGAVVAAGVVEVAPLAVGAAVVEVGAAAEVEVEVDAAAPPPKRPPVGVVPVAAGVDD